MEHQLNVAIVPSEVGEIVQSIFLAMLDLEVTEAAAPWYASPDRLTSAVHLSGDWSGAVLFECDRRQACRLAGRFLSMDAPENVDDVVRDVHGELANMIGGNLKCVLTRGIRLSMPAVVDGSDYSLRVCGAVVKERIAFDSAEGLCWVTVLATQG